MWPQLGPGRHNFAGQRVATPSSTPLYCRQHLVHLCQPRRPLFVQFDPRSPAAIPSIRYTVPFFLFIAFSSSGSIPFIIHNGMFGAIWRRGFGDGSSATPNGLSIARVVSSMHSTMLHQGVENGLNRPVFRWRIVARCYCRCYTR